MKLHRLKKLQFSPVNSFVFYIILTKNMLFINSYCTLYTIQYLLNTKNLQKRQICKCKLEYLCRYKYFSKPQFFTLTN